MAETFDPYHRWLSIPPDEQPPNHYRLLGLKVLEDNADVIESAADRQMTHVRTFQGGRYADDSQRMLNEIAAAKVVLLDPAKKVHYDAPLRQKLNREKRKRRAERPLPMAQPLSTEPVVLLIGRPPDADPATLEPAAACVAPTAPSVRVAIRRRRRGPGSGALAALSVFVVAVAAALGAAAFVVRPWEALTDEAANNGDVNDYGSTNAPVGANKPPIVLSPPLDPPTKKPPGATSASDKTVKSHSSAGVDPIDPQNGLGLDQQPAGDPPGEEPLPLAPQKKSPVPSEAERDAKRANIDAIFQTATAKTPAQKADLAEHLFRTAGETSADRVAQFVMLDLARALAADTARIQLAFDAIDLQEQYFELDADKDRILTIIVGAKAAVPNAAKQEVVPLGFELANRLAAADRYEDASKVLSTLIDLATDAQEPQLVAELREHRRINGSRFAAYRKTREALATLAQSPDNPAANLAAGRFYLLVKNDAARGLTYLSKATASELAPAAQAELAHPQSPDDQERLADLWWDVALKETDKDKQKILLSRAFAWYQRALPELKSLAAAKADKRLRELTAAGIQPADIHLDLGVFSCPPGEDADPATPLDLTTGLVAHWKFDEGQGEVARDSAGGHHGALQGATWIKGVRGGALHFDGRSRVFIPQDTKLDFAGTITLGAWVKPHVLPARSTTGYTFAVILAHGYTVEPPREVSLRIINRGAETPTAYETGSWDGANEYRASLAVPEGDVGAWVHIAGSRDGENWTLYRNGKLADSRRQPKGALSVDADWAIGGNANDGSRNFQGDIDDVRIYNRGLSADEIAAIYTGNVPTVGAVQPRNHLETARRNTSYRTAGLLYHPMPNESQIEFVEWWGIQSLRRLKTVNVPPITCPADNAGAFQGEHRAREKATEQDDATRLADGHCSDYRRECGVSHAYHDSARHITANF